MSDSQLVAVQAPVRADRITSLRTVSDLLLIEYVSQGSFNLALDKVAVTQNRSDAGQWKFNRLYQDVVSDGYFDDLSLSATSLTYVKKLDNAEPETIEYRYE